jgi:hypothetical protein
MRGSKPLRWSLLAAAAAAAAAAGCGGSGGRPRTGPTGPDPVEAIKAAGESAAVSCLKELARSRQLAAEKKKDSLGRELYQAEARVASLEQQIKGVKDSSNPDHERLNALQGELSEARKSARRESAAVGAALKPLEQEAAAWDKLRKGLDTPFVAGGVKVVSHEVLEANPKTPDERTSVMTVQPPPGQKVVTGTPKFSLTWRRTVRTTGSGIHKRERVNWELRSVAAMGEPTGSPDADAGP